MMPLAGPIGIPAVLNMASCQSAMRFQQTGRLSDGARLSVRRARSAPPFARRSPIDHMVAKGMGGAVDVFQALNRMAMPAALKA